jgi:hypothetical protein
MTTTTVPEETLAAIRIRCERLIDAAAEALDSPLCDEENADCSEARAVITGASKAATRLREHIDANYDCSTGFAEPKEEPCD